MVTRDDYKGSIPPTWCRGCGDYGILTALTRALVEQNIPPHEVIVVTGIGCGSKLPQYARINGFHSLHGRPWPIAQGIKIKARTTFRPTKFWFNRTAPARPKGIWISRDATAKYRV